MEKDKKLSVKELLQKYKLDDKDIYRINYHLNILSYDAKLLIFKILGVTDIKEEDLATEIYEIILKCDDGNPNYDQKLDEEVTRLGMKTNKYYGGHCHNIWSNGLFKDDVFDFGTSPADIYEGFVDSLDDNDISTTPLNK